MRYFRSDNPKRPVDWRWQRATALPPPAAAGYPDVRIPASTNNDAFVLRARRLIHQLSLCRGEQDYILLLDNDPDSFYAWDLRDGLEQFRWEVEARLLAGEPMAQIAKKTALPVKSIELYEAWFFNVLDRLENPGYLTHSVFMPATQRGLSARAYDCLWKMFGYWGGPIVLDLMIYQSLPAMKPDNRSGVRAFLAEDIQDSLHMKASIAMRTMPINWQTQTAIIETYYRMLEVEKSAQMGGAGSSSIVTNMETALQSLKSYWRCCEPSIGADDPVTRADAGRYSLRAAEILLLDNNPDAMKTIEPLAMSAVYPEPGESTNE